MIKIRKKKRKKKLIIKKKGIEKVKALYQKNMII
jgi:hypothetical protein